MPASAAAGRCRGAGRGAGRRHHHQRPGGAVAQRPAGLGRGTLEDFFRDQVIGGPGAFVITADADARFTEAVVRKLVLEIAERPSGPPAPRPG